MTAKEIISNANNNTMLKWVLGLMVPVMLMAVTWIFGAGKQYTNIQKIPAIEAKVNEHDKLLVGIAMDISYIKRDVEERRRRNGVR